MAFIDSIEMDSFAAACYDTNSISELEEVLLSDDADLIDMEVWDITNEEWFEQVGLALNALKEKAEGS